MELRQIYELVNSLQMQTTGGQDLTLVNNLDVIAMGEEVNGSAYQTETFMGSLAERIGRDIFSYRAYTSKFKHILVDSMVWGGIMAKTKVQMPQAVSDPAYNLENGKSVDQQTVAKPVAIQRLFTSNTPFMFEITVQRETLKRAFQSIEDLGAFIGIVYGEVQNAIEKAEEDLGRNCLNNMIAEVSGTGREIKLVTLYNTRTGKSITPAQATYDKDFLAFAVGQINLTSKKMTELTKGVFNDNTTHRHTPKNNQICYVLSDFQTNLETVLQYQAFNDGYVKLKNYNDINYFQAFDTPTDIKVNKASDGTEVTKSGIIAAMGDIEAMGIYRKDTTVDTAPYNAKGKYQNTYYHFNNLYFNDLSENFVFFTMS